MRSAERGLHMTRTWLSLFYETGYLLVAGVFLLAAPDTAFKGFYVLDDYWPDINPSISIKL